MDLNIPGTNAWGMALGKPSNAMLKQLRPEKEALDVVNTKAGRLQSSKSAQSEEEQIREAAQEFESVFLFQMLKQVRNSIHKDEEGMMNGGMGEEMFTGLLDEEYAKVMAKTNSSGLSEMIYQQMARTAGIEKAETPMPVESTQSATLFRGAVESQLRDLKSEIEAANRAAAASAVPEGSP